MEIVLVSDVLCEDFAFQATRTWDFLAEGARYKLLPGEETLTDINLLELKRRLPTFIYVEKFTRYREGRDTGADWEWWISSHDEWLGLRVQAKKLDPLTQRYELFRTDAEKALAQSESLMAAAAAGSEERLYPVYCFYNTNCPTPPDPPCSPRQPDGRVFGCTLVAAPVVRELLRAGKSLYTDFAPFAIPWSCLFCLDGADEPTYLARSAQDTLDTLLFADYPAARGAIEPEVPERVELVWRTEQPLLQPGEMDPSEVPDVSHLALATSTQPRTA